MSTINDSNTIYVWNFTVSQPFAHYYVHIYFLITIQVQNKDICKSHEEGHCKIQLLLYWSLEFYLCLLKQQRSYSTHITMMQTTKYSCSLVSGIKRHRDIIEMRNSKETYSIPSSQSFQLNIDKYKASIYLSKM